MWCGKCGAEAGGGLSLLRHQISDQGSVPTSCEFLLYKDEIHCQLQADLYADHDLVYGERIHHYFISQYIYQFPGAAVHTDGQGFCRNFRRYKFGRSDIFR